LSQLYDVYVIIHINSEEEKAQIHQLLKNANILNQSNQGSIDERKVLYCSSEEGKVHIIKHLEPSIHIEGGWEKDDGHILVQSLYEVPSVQHIVWVVSNQIRPFHEGSVDGSMIELADKMINSTLAKQVGF
jgi:hypothetical protein